MGAEDVHIREHALAGNLRREQAVAIGSLLLGARFSMEDPSGAHDRLVVAARPEHLDEVLHHLAG